MSALTVSRPSHIIEILPQGSQDLNAAADVLAEAFMYGNIDPTDPQGKGIADPFYNRLNKGDDRVRDLFRTMIGIVSEIGHTIAVVRDENHQIVGASWIKERNVRDMRMTDFPKLAKAAVHAFGIRGSIKYAADAVKHIPEYPVDSTYISMLGVDKASQGKGIAKALINYAKQSAQGHDVQLSTMNPRNVEIYKRFGFKEQPEKRKVSDDSTNRPGFTSYYMIYKA